MEKGFKVVKFDNMYRDRDLMPWIFEGINVPSIGIIGRWRDRTEPLGEAVEGPYILWRDRLQDKKDQDSMATESSLHDQVKYMDEDGHRLPYIVIEERSSLGEHHGI